MDDDEARAALVADYPGWHIWRGLDRERRPQGWFATRQGGMVVHAGGPAELRTKLETLGQAVA